AAIVAVTQELLRKASLNADVMLRDELAAAIAYRLNADFIDPAITLQAGVRPASITNGATSQASTTAAQDLNYILGNIVGAELPLSQLVLVMSGLNAFALARLRDPLGNRIYPELSVTGGTIDGVPVVVSDHVGTNVVGLVANEIYLVDEGGLDISASDQASLEMADNPSSASMGGT